MLSTLLLDSVNATIQVNLVDANKDTALHHAAASCMDDGNTRKIIETLLSKSDAADAVRKLNDMNYTPVHSAIRNSSEAIAANFDLLLRNYNEDQLDERVEPVLNFIARQNCKIYH